ncbi:MAG: Ig-like domain-containing protein [Clostridiales bacterium]|nr:Ig-like domain-containing protein [Clostridiales bacterium]
MKKKALSLFMAAVMIAATPASGTLASESTTADAVVVSEEMITSADAPEEAVIVDEGETGFDEEDAASASAGAEEMPGVSDEETSVDMDADTDVSGNDGISIVSIEEADDPEIAEASEDDIAAVSSGFTINEDEYTAFEYVGYNEEVTLTVPVESDEELTYQWYVDNGEIMELEGATSSSITVTVTGFVQYCCKVSDGNTTESVWFARSVDTGLTITAYANEVRVEKGGTTTLSVEASVDMDTTLTFKWYKVNIIDGEWFGDEIEGATTSEYTIDSVTEYGMYEAEVTDGYGNSCSCDILVYVDSGLTVSQEYFKVEAEYGGTATLSVDASVSDGGSISYQWYYEGEPVDGATNASYTVADITSYMDVYCRVCDQYGYGIYVYYAISVENNNDLEVTVESQEVYVELNDSVTLSVNVTAKETDGLTYYWTCENLASGEYFVCEDETLTLTDITNSYCCLCMVRDKYGSEEMALIYVIVENGFTITTEQTQIVSVALNGSVTLDAGVTPTDAEGMVYLWRRYDEATGEWIEETGGSTLTLTDLTLSRVCTCIVTDKYGSQKYMHFYVYIENHLVVTPDASEVTVPLNGSVTMKVTATADDPEGMTYFWYWEGVDDPENVWGTADTEDGTLEISDVTESRYYYCYVTDKYDHSESTRIFVQIGDVCAHNSASITHMEAVAATCTTAGNIEYWYCSDCGCYFSDEALTVEVSASDVVIPATGHTVVTDAAKAATCTTSGLTEGSHCSVCGEVLVAQKMVAAIGHTATGIWVTTKEATCAAAGTKVQYCKDCGTIVKTETIAKLTTHTYGEWSTTKEATVLAEGTMTRTCSVCGTKETKAIAKLTPTITVNATSIKLKKKQSTTALKVSGLAAGDSVVSWKSSNTKIVTVSSKGKITAKNKAGTAYITITLKSGKTQKIKVTVQKSAVKTTKITVDSKKVSLKKGKTYTIKATISPITSVQKVTYSSSNKKVATVSSKGKITAKKKGTATITVKSGSKKVKIKVTVK